MQKQADDLTEELGISEMMADLRSRKIHLIRALLEIPHKRSREKLAKLQALCSEEETVADQLFTLYG